MLQARAVGGQPALDGVAFAVLLLGAVWPGDELGHQRQDPGVTGSHKACGQHGMVTFDLAVQALAGLAVRASQLLGTEILCAIQSDQAASAQALERCKATMILQCGQRRVKGALQTRGMYGVKHGADVVVGRVLGMPNRL